MKEYIPWLSNFLLTMTNPIILFTDEKTSALLTQICLFSSNAKNIRIVIKPLSQLKFSTPEWIEKWSAQVPLSGFAHLHNQKLFRIWANKPFFIEDAIRENPFHSDQFVWCDAGCWRDTITSQLFGPGWPVTHKIASGHMHILTTISLLPYFEILRSRSTWTLDEFLLKMAHEKVPPYISGTILAGDIAAWTTWIQLYDVALNLCIQKNIFVGDDQFLHSVLSLWLFYSAREKAPYLYIGPESDNYLDINGMKCGIAWFFLQVAFSTQDAPLRIYT